VDARQAENGLRVLGIIGICHDPLDADRLLTRAEAASLLSRWMIGSGGDCAQIAEPTS
jgi:hypothetical protein